jgi:hypothetical protein
MTAYLYAAEGITTPIVFGWTEWPDVSVTMRTPDQKTAISAVIRPDGSVRSVSVDADSGSDITGAVLKGPAILSAMKQANGVARDLAEQIISGTDITKTVVDAKPMTDAIRTLFYEPTPKRESGRRRTGADLENMIRLVAEGYREAVAAGDPKPRVTLAKRFEYSAEHIGRLLTEARKPRNGKPPLLGPAAPGKAGEVTDGE